MGKKIDTKRKKPRELKPSPRAKPARPSAKTPATPVPKKAVKSAPSVAAAPVDTRQLPIPGTTPPVIVVPPPPPPAPTRRGGRRKPAEAVRRFSVQLPETMIARVEANAVNEGVPASIIVRRYINLGLESEK